MQHSEYRVLQTADGIKAKQDNKIKETLKKIQRKAANQSKAYFNGFSTKQHEGNQTTAQGTSCNATESIKVKHSNAPTDHLLHLKRRPERRMEEKLFCGNLNERKLPISRTNKALNNVLCGFMWRHGVNWCWSSFLICFYYCYGTI